MPVPPRPSMASMLENFDSQVETTVSGILQAIADSRYTGPVALTLHCINGIPKAIDLGPPVRMKLTGSDSG